MITSRLILVDFGNKAYVETFFNCLFSPFKIDFQIFQKCHFKNRFLLSLIYVRYSKRKLV